MFQYVEVEVENWQTLTAPVVNLPTPGNMKPIGRPRVTNSTVQKPGDDFMCSFKQCGRSYPTQDELTHHIEHTHGRKANICNRCGKTFGSHTGLVYHMSKHTGKYKFWCEICQQGFNRVERWQLHQNKHEGRGVICLNCNKYFSHEFLLKAHQKKCVIPVRT